MLGYLSADIICFEKRTVFREQSLRKTVSFEEQIMSKDKYLSIFSQPSWGYCVYYPSVLKIGEYPRTLPSFSWGIFTHVTRLDQSRASENIWWIINNNIIAVIIVIIIFIRIIGISKMEGRLWVEFERSQVYACMWNTIYKACNY